MNFFAKEMLVLTIVGIILIFFGVVSGLIYIGNFTNLKNTKEKEDSSENVFLDYCLVSRVVDVIKSFVVAVIGILVVLAVFFVQ